MLTLKAQLSNSLPLRRALRCAFAVFLGLIATYYFSRTQSFWLVLVAILLMQTEHGFPLQQGLRRFFWVLILFFVGGQAGMWLQFSWGLPAALITLMGLTAYDYAYHSRRYLGLHFSLLVLIVLLLTLLLPTPLNPSYLFDIFLGAILGLGTALLFFPDQPDQEFPTRIAPLLADLSGYLGSLVDLLAQGPKADGSVGQRRLAVEKRWANKDEEFPVWVFETGFNPALKPGQYFFVVHVGRVTEILFALHHLARHPFPADLLKEFMPVIRDSSERSQELLSNLIALLQGKPLAFSQTDFASDLPALDEQFQAKIKLSLELLDISRDYVYLAAFIRYLKDLRLELLQLAGSLHK